MSNVEKGSTFTYVGHVMANLMAPYKREAPLEIDMAAFSD